MQGADVVVVGGGIVGLSVAHGLRERGVDVAVLESGRCGLGSTAKATGGIRTQFGSEVNVRMSLLALEHFRTWAERYGGDAGYRPVGYLFLATAEAHLESQRQGASLQRSLGARVELLEPDEIARRLPGVVLDGVVGASLGPDDGLGDPGAAVTSLLSACRRLGVRVEEQTPVTRLEIRGGRVSGVRTAGGATSAGVTVLATGAWTSPLAATAGVDLPVTPHHRQVYRAARTIGVPTPSPLVVDLGSGVYFHADGPGLVFGGGDRETEPAWDDIFRPGEAPRIIELLTRRLPEMLDAELSGGWAGLREMTPDDLGIVGPAPGVEGLHVAAGFSGHGFMHAPAVGEIVASQLTGRPTPFDVSALDPARFQGEVRVEPYAF
ncbi:MAG: FAD-binding oxidoreductase [Candidatus Dormibacteraeota bacterium]|nr:FAD-binding oxidoreductase [Candidatus Dormibacteraeota bacterium]MBO0760142.1 FAD-binding oxidoreductase [Candidatus Dormibacteraeota bacterium]